MAISAYKRKPTISDDELLALPLPPPLAPDRTGGKPIKPGMIVNPNGYPNTRGGEVKPIRRDMLPKIRAAAAAGWTEGSIARDICGISATTFIGRKKDHPEIGEALAAGRDDMHNALVAALMQSVAKGNFVPALFMLKTRYGYRETDAPQDQRPQITINLPGALSVAEYAKGITIEADGETGNALSVVPGELTRG